MVILIVRKQQISTLSSLVDSYAITEIKIWLHYPKHVSNKQQKFSTSPPV